MQATPSPAAPASEPISDLFWDVARRLRHLSRHTLSPLDVTPSHARALAVLGGHPGLRLSELSDLLHIAPRSTTEVVDALVARGLASRRPDPGDRRATIVEITEPGRELSAAIRAARATESEAFFAVLDDDERAALARLLRRLQA